jgi:hypothetical protein
MKKNLRWFLSDLNETRKSLKQKKLTVPTCLEDSKCIIDALESRLSPENLHCDGEISFSEAQDNYNYYMNVLEDLEELICQKVEICL